MLIRLLFKIRINHFKTNTLIYKLIFKKMIKLKILILLILLWFKALLIVEKNYSFKYKNNLVLLPADIKFVPKNVLIIKMNLFIIES